MNIAQCAEISAKCQELLEKLDNECCDSKEREEIEAALEDLSMQEFDLLFEHVQA